MYLGIYYKTGTELLCWTRLWKWDRIMKLQVDYRPGINYATGTKLWNWTNLQKFN